MERYQCQNTGDIKTLILKPITSHLKVITSHSEGDTSHSEGDYFSFGRRIFLIRKAITAHT